MLLDDAYMPPVAAVVEHCRNSAAWQTEPAVSFRTAVVRKLADETIDGEWKGHRMNFAYLPLASEPSLPSASASSRRRSG